MEKLILQCPYGNITNIIPNGIGLNPHDGVKNVQMDACLVNQTTNGKCNPVLNLKNLEASFNKSCKGNTTCTLEMYKAGKQDPDYFHSFALSGTSKEVYDGCSNPRS